MKTLEITDDAYDMLRKCIINNIDYIMSNRNPTTARWELMAMREIIKQFNIVDDDVSEVYSFEYYLMED